MDPPTSGSSMDEFVPHFDSLADVYYDPSAPNGVAVDCEKRWKSLLSEFKDIFNCRPDFVARSPGRVNIIGEHIDYSMYGVLPMAVTADALIAVSVATTIASRPMVTIANLNSEKFASQDFEIPAKGPIEIDTSKHDWTNYFKAGLRGAVQFCREQAESEWVPASMKILVDGNVPVGGGLSSSAALVCASALCVLTANSFPVSKHVLMEMAVISERAVGVFSGGMDQAASIFSKRDFLLGCTFYPSFRAEDISVPKSDPEFTFLVAQSFVAADKHVSAQKHYNLRVVECTMATLILAKLLDVVMDEDQSPLMFSLRNLQEQLMRKQGLLYHTPEEQLDAMTSIMESKLDREDGYSREDMAQILDVSVEHLEEVHMSKFPVQADRFQLRKRALHVLSEAQRVLIFKKILSDAQQSHEGLGEQQLRLLGDLMNKTQESCSKVYDCSVPELDEICAIARKAGTYGSRLTGAGWGGCTVHLLAQSKVEQVTKALKEEYYLKHFPDISDERLKEALVISKPGPGSAILAGRAMRLP